jgi:excinuclease UvrABC helicase subunit UvrB
MLFRNFNNLNRLFRDLNSFDEFFDDLTHIKDKEQIQTGKDENGEWERRTYVSDTGLFSYSFLTRKSSLEKLDELYTLKNMLDDAVEKQDFEKAVELRDKIKKLEENKEEIKSLINELTDSIKKQDFENAIVVRDKIKKLK